HRGLRISRASLASAGLTVCGIPLSGIGQRPGSPAAPLTSPAARFNVPSGYTDENPRCELVALREHVGAGRPDAGPSPPGAGAPRADGLRAVCDLPAPAVHDEPAPEGALGRGVAGGAGRGDESPLPDARG